MLVLGIDLGTSSVKVSVVDSATGNCIATARFPESESPILSNQPGWAEQDPGQWWHDVQHAILQCHASGRYDPFSIGAIGIAYQMHGLVLVNNEGRVLRNAIIWCDSRAVAIGEKALQGLGIEFCNGHLLNAPGNFTASKLAWVKEHEPEIYLQVDKVLLPGDFIALQLTGSVTTTASALSEGIFWDFRQNNISTEVLDWFGFERDLFPAEQPVFSVHGELLPDVAASLSLKTGIPVSYKAGDQLNNALALGVLQAGEVAATAGTSGVIYSVSNHLVQDAQSRVNSFAHVNHTVDQPSIGVLLCINGAGSFNRWVKQLAGSNYSYQQLNEAAATAPPGAAGLLAFPFGNGAERMLNNRNPGAHFSNLQLNLHGLPHMARAVQEGIAFAFRYGMDIMAENGMTCGVVRAAQTNLFLSPVFAQTFADVNNTAVEFYDGDGSYGAAVGALGGLSGKTHLSGLPARAPIARIEPAQPDEYETHYQAWKNMLQSIIAAPSKAAVIADH